MPRRRNADDPRTAIRELGPLVIAHVFTRWARLTIAEQSRVYGLLGEIMETIHQPIAKVVPIERARARRGHR